MRHAHSLSALGLRSPWTRLLNSTPALSPPPTATPTGTVEGNDIKMQEPAVVPFYMSQREKQHQSPGVRVKSSSPLGASSHSPSRVASPISKPLDPFPTKDAFVAPSVVSPGFQFNACRISNPPSDPRRGGDSGSTGRFASTIPSWA